MSVSYDARMERILPIDLLRTLLVLARTQSFSRTGEEIGRSQSAVSLQMRRLQQIVGSPILTNSGKSFSLTQQGEIVLEYAKQIVALNDECVGRLDGGILTGTIRVGIPSDFALSFLPQLLGRFSETHPDVALDVTCELSRDLIGGLARNAFDVVLAVHDDRSTAHLTDQWREPMAWVGSETYDLRARRPLPLVLFPDGCQYRLRVLSALRRRDIPIGSSIPARISPAIRRRSKAASASRLFHRARCRPRSARCRRVRSCPLSTTSTSASSGTPPGRPAPFAR